jgi:hypothetical protein
MIAKPDQHLLQIFSTKLNIILMCAGQQMGAHTELA